MLQALASVKDWNNSESHAEARGKKWKWQNNITTFFVFFKCFRYPRDGAKEKISQKWIMKRCLELCGITMIRILYVKLLVKGNTNAKV